MRIATAALLLTFSATALSADSHRAKVAQTPDFLQTDREAGFAKGGSQFCAPTAVSNSLMWLAANGYDDLRPEGNTKRAQIAMIRTLSGRNYMNTSPTRGTDVEQVLAGVETYVTENGYTIEELSFEGWRPVPEEYHYSEHPDLDDVKASIADEQSAVWLNVGWYTYDEDTGDYRRSGGHWVTVVGYVDDDLLIHDPQPGAGSSLRTQRISFEEITEGRLTGGYPNLPRSAEGYYEVGGEMVTGSKTCILDGVVFLKLE
ncbi:MAG TPA: hypothetical protein VEK11_20235 [Thermoanaerobaculia bacterium]|nr:hypothetical protein [Thermoanaerobaculia bacterium]